MVFQIQQNCTKMIKSPLYNNRSHSSQCQKHSSAIISIDRKYPNNKKGNLSKNYLSPQQKNNILENGPMILQFVNERFKMLNEVNCCNEKMTIENYGNEGVSYEIGKMEQNLEFIKNDILPAYQIKLNSSRSCSQLNEAIYSILNELSELHSKILQRLNSCKQASQIKANQSNRANQKLKDYFYSFVISLAATDTQYHEFLDSLYDELFFDTQFSPQKVQKVMTEDTEYCIKILILALSNKFHNMIKDSKFTQNPKIVYFPNQITFLKLIFNFILTNTQQMTDKLSHFINKYRTIRTFIEDNQTANEHQSSQNLKNTLSRYLPKQLQAQATHGPQYTFSPRDLLNLKNNMIRSYNIKTHIDEWSFALGILERAFSKICFNRILTCKRHNFYAAQAIFHTIKSSKIHKQLAFEGLKRILSFAEQLKQYEKRESEALIKFNKKLFEKVFIGWRAVKQRRSRLLRQLIKKKGRTQKKEQTLMFNLWRINISRMRICSKMLAHSSSCTAVINKFTEQEIETYESKKQRNTQQIQKSLYKMSGITLKKSNSYRSGLSQSRMTNNSKPKNAGIHHNTNNQDLKLLNYQYKQSIIQKLKRKTRKDKDNSKQAPNKTSTFVQSKTLLKV